MTLLESNRVFDRLAVLAECLCATLTVETKAAGCFCGIQPGEAAAADYIGTCDDCGMAWVRLVNLYPATAIGEANVDVNNCDKLEGFDVEVGVMRCIMSGQPDGEPPTEAELLEATHLQIADALAMKKAILCCDIGDVVLGTYAPIGPGGGVLGGTWTISLMDV